MAKRVVMDNQVTADLPRPALTPEAREQQIINRAYNLAEKQIMDGTASSQIITHFLKLGSEKERLERERLAEENKLLKAKTEALQSAKRSEELYEKAMTAFTNYSYSPPTGD